MQRNLKEWKEEGDAGARKVRKKETRAQAQGGLIQLLLNAPDAPCSIAQISDTASGMHSSIYYSPLGSICSLT